MNFGLAVSQWHRYPKLAFTSGTDEMFTQKKNRVMYNKMFMAIIR